MKDPDYFARLPSNPWQGPFSDNSDLFQVNASDIHDRLGKAFVKQQPKTEEEMAKMSDVLSVCPTHSIVERGD